MLALEFCYHFSVVSSYTSCSFIIWCCCCFFFFHFPFRKLRVHVSECSKSFCRYFGQQILPLANNYVSLFKRADIKIQRTPNCVCVCVCGVGEKKGNAFVQSKCVHFVTREQANW